MLSNVTKLDQIKSFFNNLEENPVKLRNIMLSNVAKLNFIWISGNAIVGRVVSSHTITSCDLKFTVVPILHT